MKNECRPDRSWLFHELLMPEMYDNFLNFEPTFFDTGILYNPMECQASVCSGRQECYMRTPT